MTCPDCGQPMEPPLEETENYEPTEPERLWLCHNHWYAAPDGTFYGWCYP